MRYKWVFLSTMSILASVKNKEGTLLSLGGYRNSKRLLRDGRLFETPAAGMPCTSRIMIRCVYFARAPQAHLIVWQSQPRSISRFANDSPKWRASSGKLLCMLHTTLFGTVYLHQGQEIGLINIPKDWPLNEWKDVQTQNIIRS